MARRLQAKNRAIVINPRSSRRSARTTKRISEMSFEEIDAHCHYSPPPDPEEHMHPDDLKIKQPNAALISGTPRDHDVDQHPGVQDARREKNSSAAKTLFYSACDANAKAYLAGLPHKICHENMFDGPGVQGPFDINDWKSSVGDLRLETILRLIDTAATRSDLRKFIHYLVEEVPILDPPHWVLEHPIREGRLQRPRSGKGKHFSIRGETDPPRPHSLSFPDPNKPGKIIEFDKPWISYQDPYNMSDDLVDYLTTLSRNHDCVQDPGISLSTTNAILIIQVCQVLTKLPWKEEQYRMRPMVRMPIPEVLKGVLVDDWENVTKTLMLVKLPSERPVNWILDEYLTQKRKGMDLGSSDASILHEFVEGMKLYFKQALGRLLLYRFERDQYADLGKKYWNKVGLQTVRRVDPVNNTETEEQNHVNVGDVYGAEHLCRLLGKSSAHPIHLVPTVHVRKRESRLTHV